MDYHGRILGMVGGTGKKKANRVLNRAWQSKRQPGSVIKPLSVYGPALEKTLQDDETNVFWSTPTKDAPLTKITKDDKDKFYYVYLSYGPYNYANEEF